MVVGWSACCQPEQTVQRRADLVAIGASLFDPNWAASQPMPGADPDFSDWPQSNMAVRRGVNRCREYRTRTLCA